MAKIKMHSCSARKKSLQDAFVHNLRKVYVHLHKLQKRREEMCRKKFEQKRVSED